MEAKNDDFDFYQMGYDAKSEGRSKDDLYKVVASLSRKYGGASARLFEAGVYAYQNETLMTDTYDSLEIIADEFNCIGRKK